MLLGGASEKTVIDLNLRDCGRISCGEFVPEAAAARFVFGTRTGKLGVVQLKPDSVVSTKIFTWGNYPVDELWVFPQSNLALVRQLNSLSLVEISEEAKLRGKHVAESEILAAAVSPAKKLVAYSTAAGTVVVLVLPKLDQIRKLDSPVAGYVFSLEDINRAHAVCWADDTRLIVMGYNSLAALELDQEKDIEFALRVFDVKASLAAENTGRPVPEKSRAPSLAGICMTVEA